MALDFTRPDPASPASVSSAQFPVSRRGYDQAEVRDFLRMVAAEQARLQERERSLERELKALREAKAPQQSVIDEDTATRLLGEEAARVLQTAREAAAQIRGRAEESSARLLREATDEAQRLREEAEIEAARRRQDAAADSESELQMAKQQGRDMVNEARAYRERVLSELARRRELARQQIEQLIHGRDRLLQAFERSRIAAVEVMAELTPLGEPDEYVNLQPTTGPVPLMVPSTPRPAVGYVIAEDEAHEHADAAPVVAPHEPEVFDVSDATRAIDLVLAPEDDTAPEAAVDAEEVSDGDPTAELNEDELDVDMLADDAVPLPHEVVDPAATRAHGDLDVEGDVDLDLDANGDTTNVIPMPEVVADEVTDETLAADAARPPADVVSLFSGEVEPPEPATADATASTAGNASVDDLFARLRAARAEDVVAKIAEQPKAAKAPAVVVQAAEPVVESKAGPAEPAPEVVVELSAEEIVVPIILSAARKLKRVLADEQNELLDTLRRKEPVRALDALLPWEADHTGRYAAVVEPDLLAAALAGADGGDNGANAAIIRPALDAVTNDIVAPLRDRLIRCIDKANGDNAELGQQVRTLYREWKTHRIDEHVEDIVRLAYDRGALTLSTR
ncbi:MAG: hypothetical protein JWN62_2754 [Acidimicrobiales bacterium]|nr:hypothetical protein [Acidimicrobiales bacterium]